jgi:hypothetical protein
VHFLRYEIATTNITIRASWEKTGFGYVQKERTYYLFVNEGEVRAIPEFAEVQQTNYNPSQLSARKRQHKWAGSTNATFASNHGKLRGSKD